MTGKRKSLRISKNKSQVVPSGIDATPERMARDDSAVVPAPQVQGGRVERTSRVRRFASSQLDREFAAGRITLAQHQAGQSYAELHQAAHTAPSIVANYGPVIPSGSPAYGHLPRSERQVHARERLAVVDRKLGAPMARFAMVFLILDRLPRSGGREREARVAQIRDLLNALAGT